MGIINKLMFWKHNDFPVPSTEGHELGLGREHDTALGLEEPEFSAPPGQIPTAESQQQNPAYPSPPTNNSLQQPGSDLSKDVQILSIKLDSLKAILDNINQRLANIERIANESQQSEKKDIYEHY